MKKAIITFSALLLSVSMLGGTVQAAGSTALVATSVTQQTTYSGTCGAKGSDVTWTYDTETETLTISGTGKVEAYVENGATIKTPGWMANGIPFEATHAVIEDGITGVGEGFCENCFGGSAGALKLEVSESVKNMDLESLLNNENVYFYGKKESWFYYSVYQTDRFISTGTATEKYVPTSGTYSDGATWSYDIETRTLTVDGNGMIAESEYMEHFGQSAEKVVFGRDVQPPDRTDSNGLNLFLYSCIAQYTSEDGPEVCLYRNSVMGAEYEKFYAYQLNQSGKDEDWVNQHYPVTLLESGTGGDLYLTKTYGTVDGGATWEFDCSSRTLVFDNGTINKIPYLDDQIPSDVWYCTESIVWGKNLIPNEETASLDSVTYNAFVFRVALSDSNFTEKTMYCYANSAFAKEYEVLTGNPDVFNNFYAERRENS